ncbi:ABC transporter ATP-binding protein [Streptomyces alkaliterrae]|uniref:ABC transporter ATP-binding protein n=1 Tax=Streptomyces alkaliterrae TaxID=2213162 RepID=A0A5P0YYK4_9ACTN|nr:ABC transporter ATP-binding protein [Streptomyces alkaliterrae]MBB1262072.1 ABC transporter ATP-binding protein [Streptomyces alkaliterrae]MQS05384.1 ATP-binding cassette domain-containing protein [Streptomyces alkaliterrae]
MGNEREAVLLLRDIDQSYGARQVLERVNARVDAGACVALLGENGSGKSTLLRLAAGREEPAAGSVLFRGECLAEDHRRRRSEVASVLDHASHYPDLTVHEHLMLVALAHGHDRRAHTVVDAALDAHRLAGHAEAYPDELSSGQRQLMALATTEVRPYSLLLLDEPEQRLDADARRELAERLTAARRRGAAVLLATHDRTLADAVADTRLVLAHGRLVDDH